MVETPPVKVKESMLSNAEASPFMRHLHLPTVDQHKELASCIPFLCLPYRLYPREPQA